MTLREARPVDQVSWDWEEGKVTWPQTHYYLESNGREEISEKRWNYWEEIKKEEEREKVRAEEKYRQGLSERIAALERQKANQRKMEEEQRLYYRRKALELAKLPVHWAGYSDGKIAALVNFGNFGDYAICYVNVNGKAERQ